MPDRADGAAAKAGMKAGDVIVDIAGQQVRDINTFRDLMSQQKAGEPIARGAFERVATTSVSLTVPPSSSPLTLHSPWDAVSARYVALSKGGATGAPHFE